MRARCRPTGKASTPSNGCSGKVDAKSHCLIPLFLVNPHQQPISPPSARPPLIQRSPCARHVSGAVQQGRCRKKRGQSVKFDINKAWVSLSAITAVFGLPGPAGAQEVEVTYTGTIIGGDGATDGNAAPDRLGLFGTAGASVTGDTYTATYIFNTNLGTLTSACVPNSANCSSGTTAVTSPPGVIPVVSETLTINGKSFSFGGATYPVNGATLEGINNGSSNPSTFFAEVEANGDLNSLRDDLTINNGSLPSSLVTPFTYTVHSGDGADSTDSFFQADTDGTIDRFEFSIASVTLAPVPLPAAAWLLVGGLCGLGLASKRKRQELAV
jgi:hypothetical protein